MVARILIFDPNQKKNKTLQSVLRPGGKKRTSLESPNHSQTNQQLNSRGFRFWSR